MIKKTFVNNLKLLRKQRKKTQDDVAHSLNLKRTTYSGYENHVSFPDIETLVAISKYYNVSLDSLLNYDLSTLTEWELSTLRKGFDVYRKNENKRIMVAHGIVH